MKSNLAMLVLAFGATAVAGYGTTIGNNSFEVPALSPGGYQYNPTGSGVDWVFSGQSGITYAGGPFNGPSAPNGNQYAFLQAYNGTVQGQSAPGSFSQNISGLIPGDTYQFTFYAAQRPGYTEDRFSVLFGTYILGPFDPNSTSFVQETGAAPATLSTETLQFSSISTGCTDCDSFVDLVNVTDLGPSTTGTPEPATAALVIPALAALVFLRRRRMKPA